MSEQQMIDLCDWIDQNISQPIGWTELIQASGLDHLSIQAAFFKYKSTTPMTWIRNRRLESKALICTPVSINHKILP